MNELSYRLLCGERADVQKRSFVHIGDIIVGKLIMVTNH